MVDAIAKAASNKAELCNNHFGKYFMRSIMAGFYIVVATILSNVSAAVLLPTYPQFGKLLGAFLFFNCNCTRRIYGRRIIYR